MKKLSIVFVLLCMAFIFYNSSNNFVTSNEISFKFLNVLRNSKNIVMEKDNNSNSNSNSNVEVYESEGLLPQTERDEKLNELLRKNAHAFEYIVLTMLVSHMLILYGVKGRDAIIYILFISLFFAVTDEFHQIFVPGRGSSVSDVLIDFLGSLIGLGSYYLFKFRLLKRKKPKNINL